MFFDLNVPVPQTLLVSGNATRKGKEKQTDAPAFSASSIASLEARIDTLVHLGYTALAFNQIVESKVDPKKHTNYLDALLRQIKPRQGIVFLKRLTIVLGAESEKGFGLTNNNTAFFNTYDILSLVPTTQATFSLACLTHSQPSPLTAHAISLPLTLPRLPFPLKHTLIRTALRNGAVFEIPYVGAIGGEPPEDLGSAAEGGMNAKRNWWASARELARVTRGKGILLSGGVVDNADLRAPRDAVNLISMLGIAQDAAHAAATAVPKSVILRAQGRKTYRAILSEPVVVLPDQEPSTTPIEPAEPPPQEAASVQPVPQNAPQQQGKRPREEEPSSLSKGEKKKKRKK